MPDSVAMWKTGLSARDAELAGKWRNQSAAKPARSVKAVAPAGLQLSTPTRGSAFLGTATLQKTGSRQSTKMAKNTYLAFGHADMRIVSTLTTSGNSDSVIKNLWRL